MGILVKVIVMYTLLCIMVTFFYDGPPLSERLRRVRRAVIPGGGKTVEEVNAGFFTEMEAWLQSKLHPPNITDNSTLTNGTGTGNGTDQPAPPPPEGGNLTNQTRR